MPAVPCAAPRVAEWTRCAAQPHFYTMSFYVTINDCAINSATVVELVNYRSNHYEIV